MKKILTRFSFLLFLATGAAYGQDQSKEIATDLVCGMSVNKTESYDFKYKGAMYYFDSYDCREAFKSNPDNFVFKKCTANDRVVDPVCGVKVNITECYDLKYHGRVYHFHTVGCKEAFKMNPVKFIRNFCGGDTLARVKP